MNNGGRVELRAIKGAVLVLLACALTACGTMSNRFAPELLTPALIAQEGNGVVLISTSAADKCVSFSTFIALHPQGESYTTNAAAQPVDAYVMKSDLENGFGFINAFALHAGNYYFSPWLANPYFVATRSPRYDFTVAAGEVVYLGQYHQPGRCAIGDGVISDQWERDRAMIAARNSNIDLSHVNTRLLRYSGAAVTGENGPPTDRYDEVNPNAVQTKPEPTPTSTAPPPQQ